MLRSIKNRVSPEMFLSLMIYGLGMGAYFVLDIYISVTYEAPVVADWAFFKSYLFFASALCVLGYDQVVLRDLAIVRNHFKRFLLQAIAIAMLVSLAVWLLFNKGNFFVLFGCAVILAVLAYLAGAARAQMKFVIAQLFTNGWRVLLLLIVLFGGIGKIGIGITYLVAMVTFLIISFALAFNVVNAEKGASTLSDSVIRHLGFSFFLGNMTLVIALHGEQLLINLFDDIAASHLLFIHVAILTPAIVGLNGFIGFFLGPIIRQNKSFGVDAFRELNFKLFLISVPLAASSYLVGWFVFHYLVKSQSFDVPLAVFILMTCWVRNMYIAPSVVLAGFASARHLRLSMLLNWIFLSIYLMMVCFVLWCMDGLSAARWVAALTLFHWVVRCISGNYFSLQSVRLKEVHN